MIGSVEHRPNQLPNHWCTYWIVRRLETMYGGLSGETGDLRHISLFVPWTLRGKHPSSAVLFPCGVSASPQAPSNEADQQWARNLVNCNEKSFFKAVIAGQRTWHWCITGKRWGKKCSGIAFHCALNKSPFWVSWIAFLSSLGRYHQVSPLNIAALVIKVLIY